MYQSSNSVSTTRCLVKILSGGALLMDVYHELVYPFEVMTKVRKTLKPGGRVVFVEYRKEDPRVPIKMSVVQLENEMRVVGLVRVRTLETLPSQHIVIFERRE
jgi:hypothetical protein